MNLFKTDHLITVSPVECLEGGDWQGPRTLKSRGGLILTDTTDKEHDILVDFCQGYDPTGLKGIMVSLHVENKNEDDPPEVNLLARPAAGQVIRHQDKYYLVKVVVQSSNGSAAVFVSRLPVSAFWTLTASAVPVQ